MIFSVLILAFMFLPSESAKIFEEFCFFFFRKIGKRSIFEKKRDQTCKKIADSGGRNMKVEIINFLILKT